MSKEFITKDDLTGRESTETSEVPLLFNDVAYTMDLEPESVEALAALFGDHHDRSLVRALIAPPVIAAVVVKPKTTRSGPTDRQIREWARAEGREVSDKGKVKKADRDAYLAAHG